MDNGLKGNSMGSAKPTNMLAMMEQKTGLRFNMIMLSFKGALPPLIAIAAYQAPAWARIYTTLGYFVAIIALLSMAMQPRAKFFQSIFTNTVFISFAAAINLLVILCAVKARDPSNNKNLHGGSSGSIEATAYDSSANAVAATWLFLNVFLTNYLKAKRPQLAVPAIQSNIYGVVAAVYAPSFPDMDAGLDFSRRLLVSFLTAYAIAAAVNVLIWPTTSRDEVKRQSASLIDSLKECIAKYRTYTDSSSKSMEMQQDSDDPVSLFQDLKDQSRETSALFGKIKLELEFARKEVAYGKLKPDHLHKLYVGMREILQPIMGLTTFLDIVTNVHHNDDSFEATGSSQILQAIRELEPDEWKAIVKTCSDSHAQLQEAMCQGLDHISIQLRLVSKPKAPRIDVEHLAVPQPGHTSFARHLEQELRKCRVEHDKFVQEWLNQSQINSQGVQPTFPTSSHRSETRLFSTHASKGSRDRQLQLYLYLNFLLYNTGDAILRQVHFADSLVADGTMSRNRFIFPGCRTTSELMMGAFLDPDQDEAMGINPNNGSNIWVGDLFNHKKDPEHLPPTNAYERCTDFLRRIPQSLSSSHASFGLRCAVATLSTAIAGFLARSRPFFLDQRGIWAASTTAIAMTPQFGASLSAFCMRILGTAAAAGLSISITYSADHSRAGIIILFYFLIVGLLCLVARFPSFESAGTIASAAVIIIIGYQLQVDVIGIAQSTSDGQVYYPVYLLGPYRLVAIIAGLAVAFFWSLFPFPITSHGSLRQDTANTLYVLANYHSCVHATLDVYLRFGPEISKLPDSHPISRLEEARQEVFGKSILMLNRLRDHLKSSRFEPRIGGKFPRDQYEQIIESLSHVFTYLALMIYSSKTFIRDSEYTSGTGETIKESDLEDEEQCLKEFRESVADTRVTSQKLTSTLCLLAASVHNEQPLPPYLSLSKNDDPAEKLNEISPDSLDMRRLIHACYAAFTVNQITGSLLNAEMTKLTKLIKELVGEIDFTFHVMSTNDDSASTLTNTYSYGKVGTNDKDWMNMKEL